jgi:MtN3 and saliva related transmembrane protein
MESTIGIIAGVLTGVSMLPQLVKIIKEKDGRTISVGMLLILISGLSMWVWYGFLKGDAPIIVTNSFSILVNLVILSLKFVYKRKN